MKIEVAKIPKSGITLEEEEPPQVMESGVDGVVYDQPIRVSVSVNLVGRILVVRGRLKSVAVLECSRCLRKFDYRVDVGDYIYSAEVKPDETVDLTDSIREDIMVGLPMKRLCSPECKGLCPICGQDLNLSTCHCSRSQSLGPFSGLDGLKA